MRIKNSLNKNKKNLNNNHNNFISLRINDTQNTTAIPYSPQI